MSDKYPANDLPADIKQETTNNMPPKPEPPDVQDEEWQEGVESDDNIDELGKTIGVSYQDGEEIDITKKVPYTTESDPPEDNTDQ